MTTGSGEFQALTVKVDGQGLPTDWENAAFSVRIDRQLCLTGRAVLRFRDPGLVLSQQRTFAIGTAVAIAGADGTSVFSGTVTAFTVEQRESAGPEVHVTVDDGGHLLALSSDTAAYLNTTYDSVLNTAVQAAGLTLKASGADGITYDYLLQSGTALDYLDEVAARTGRVWWVDGTSVHLVPPSNATLAATLTLGENLRSISVRASGHRPSGFKVASWDAATLASVLVDAGPVSGLPEAPSFHGDSLARTATTVRDSRTLTTAEAKVVGQSIQSQAESESVLAQGTCEFSSALVPGSLIQLKQAGNANESYLLTAVEHVWEPYDGLQTRFTAGSLRPSGLVDVLGRRPSAGFTIGGVLAAVVTNVQDPEKKGRVKLKYSTQGDAVESPWARLVSVGAGAQRGFEFSPEVGDEVLVAFEEGDTRRPVVLGGLFSQKNAFAGASTDGNLDGDKVGYRRMTSRLGHKIELADGSGAATQHILMQLAGGKHKIRVGADKMDVITDGLPITMTNGKATVTLADNGDITLEGTNVTIKASSKISLESQGEVSVKGLQVAVEGKSAMTLKANGTGSLEAGGPLTVKGATVAIN
jgi:uncharacterized protein involved in type VI secretion and phage assembly